MNALGRTSIIAAAFLAAAPSSGLRADDDAKRDCGDGWVYCSSCEECAVLPERSYLEPTCVPWYPGQHREGLILGYFEGCTEYIPCDEVIPCTNPESEENTPEDMALLARALGTNLAGAHAYLTKYAGRIVHAHDRNAVQILGCGDAVRAHIPFRPLVAHSRAPRLRAAIGYIASLFGRARTHAIAML